MRSELPGLRSLVSDHPGEDEAQVLHYLRQGVFGSWYPDPGLEYDVLRKEVKINLQPFGNARGLHPHCLLTDGRWLWPAVPLYYVSQYHLRLEADFVRHAQANQWTVRPETIDVSDLGWDAFEGAVPDLAGKPGP